MSAPLRGLDAVILAGGRGRRMDGAHKPGLVVGGRTLLDHALAAARAAGAQRIVVVGPPVPDLEGAGAVVFAREDPPFGGPVAGLAAGLELVAAELVLVLASDLPFAAAAAAPLAAAATELSEPADGVCLIDSAGRAQWLAAIYRRESLSRALAALPTAHGAAMRTLLGEFHLLEVTGDERAAVDVDTWDDLRSAQAMTSTAEGPP